MYDRGVKIVKVTTEVYDRGVKVRPGHNRNSSLRRKLPVLFSNVLMGHKLPQFVLNMFYYILDSNVTCVINEVTVCYLWVFLSGFCQPVLPVI